MKTSSLLGLVVLLLLSQHAIAQVNVAIILRSPVPSQLSVWERDRSVLQVSMWPGFEVQGARMSFTIRDLNTGVIAAHSLDDNPAIPQFNLTRAQPRVFSGPELISASAIEIQDDYKHKAIATNSLPEGEYEICIRLFMRDGHELAITGSNCRSFVIVAADPPTLLLPENHFVVDRDSGLVRFGDGEQGRRPPTGSGLGFTPMTFSWTPVIIAPGILTRYRFTLAPIFDHQSARDAVDRNAPLLQQESAIPNFVYTPAHPDFSLYPSAVGFAWQVQALDPEGRAATRNEGKSEIFQFTLGSRRSSLPPAPTPTPSPAPAPSPGPAQPPAIVTMRPSLLPMTSVAGTIEWGFRPPSPQPAPAATGNGARKMVLGKSLTLKSNASALPLKQGASSHLYLIPELAFSLPLEKTFPLRHTPLELVQTTTSPKVNASAGGTIKVVQVSSYRVVASTTTDGDGNFSFIFFNKDSSSNVKKITYSVRVRDFHFEDPPDAFEVKPNAGLTGLKLQATARAYAIRTRVVEEEGDLPVKGATVVIYRQSGAWHAPQEEGNIEDKSTHAYPAVPAYAKPVQTYAVKSYTGVGTPVSGAGAVSPYAQLSMLSSSWDPLYLCTEAKDGVYNADPTFMNDPGLAKDYYRLVVTAPGHERSIEGHLESKALTTGKGPLEYTVKLKKAKPAVHGIVTRSDNGSPVSGALVEVYEGSPASHSSLAFGKFSGILSSSILRPTGGPITPAPPSGVKKPLATGLITASPPGAKNQWSGSPARSTFSVGSLLGSSGVNVLLPPPNPLAVLTGQDGSYRISNVSPKPAYMIKVTKSGFKMEPRPVTLNEMGLDVEMNLQLDPMTVELSGLIVDDEGIPLANAGVKSVTSPQTYYSGSDGRFAGLFGVGNDTLHVFKPGYSDRVFGLTIKKGGTRVSGGATIDTMVVQKIVLPLRAAKLLVTVVDSAGHLPLKDAAVVLGDSDQVGVTGTDGTFFFNRAPSTATVTINGPEDQDYVRSVLNASLVVSEIDTNRLTIALLQGGRFSGTVRRSSDNAVVDGARVRVEGIPGLEAFTDNSGAYVLHGVPPDEGLTLKASKTGLVGSSKGGQLVSSGGNTTADFMLSTTPFALDKLLGFDIDVDTLIVSGPDMLLSGSFIHLPNNPFARVKSSGTRVPFTLAKIHQSGGGVLPEGNTVKTDVTQIPVKLFDQVDAVLTDETGIRVSWNSGAAAGEFAGSIGLSLAPLFGSIPGLVSLTAPLQTVTLPISGNSTIPAITSNGALPFSHDSLGLSAGSALKLNLWGTELTVDLTHSSLKADGLHYHGSLKMPSIAGFSFPDLHFMNLHIDKAGVKGVEVSSSPPLQVAFPGGWKAQIDQISFRETGFSLGGSLAFVLPGMAPQTVAFSELKLSTTDFFGGKFLVDKINLFNITEFTVPGKVLAFGKAEAAYFLQGSGKISLKYIKDLTIENFLVRTDGKLLVKVPINLKFNFAFVKVTLKSAQFSTLSTPVSLDITGDVDLNLPGLSAKVGGFHFKPGGVFSVDELGLGFTAGPVDVAVNVAFINDGFIGKGKALIAGLPGLGVEFAYTSTLLRIEFSVGVIIPVAPPSTLVITEVRGGIERNYNVWTVHIGGSLALSPGSQSALKLDIDVYVSNGPVIKGKGAIYALNKFNLAGASLEINIPQKYVLGSVWIDLPDIIPIVSARGTLNFEVRSANFWFLDAGLEVRMRVLGTDLFKGNFGVAIGKNYNPTPQQNALAGRVGNVSTINGIRVDASIYQSIGSKSGIDLIIVSGAAWASFNARGALIMNFGSVYGAEMEAHWDLGAKACFMGICIGGGGTADVAVSAYYYVSKGWDIDFSGRVSAYLEGGDCSPGCNEIDECWDWPPVGGKVCMSLAAQARVSTSGGWSLNISR